MTTWRSTESFGDSSDWPLNDREQTMFAQVCDPPSDRLGESADARAQKREQEQRRAYRQRNKVGRPCPHRCGFYLPTDRTYGAALSTHERKCPKAGRA